MLFFTPDNNKGGKDHRTVGPTSPQPRPAAPPTDLSRVPSGPGLLFLLVPLPVPAAPSFPPPPPGLCKTVAPRSRSTASFAHPRGPGTASLPAPGSPYEDTDPPQHTDPPRHGPGGAGRAPRPPWRERALTAAAQSDWPAGQSLKARASTGSGISAATAGFGLRVPLRLRARGRQGRVGSARRGRFGRWASGACGQRPAPSRGPSRDAGLAFTFETGAPTHPPLPPPLPPRAPPGGDRFAFISGRLRAQSGGAERPAPPAPLPLRGPTPSGSE